MKKIRFCTAGDSQSLLHARNCLLAWGYDVLPSPDLTATHLLLPIPSLDPQGLIRGGPPLQQILAQCSPEITVLGGILPDLPVRHWDLLQDPHYIAENAAITAHCTLGIVLQHLPFTLAGKPVLILGWGRIGKCLAQLLSGMGAQVTVAARDEYDRAMIQALRLGAAELPPADVTGYLMIINTIPAPVLNAADAAPDALLVDLASARGIYGEGVLWERRLPERRAPQSAGILIAKTALRYALGKE